MTVVVVARIGVAIPLGMILMSLVFAAAGSIGVAAPSPSSATHGGGDIPLGPPDGLGDDRTQRQGSVAVVGGVGEAAHQGIGYSFATEDSGTGSGSTDCIGSGHRNASPEGLPVW